MSVFQSERIRNTALVSHGGAGKTSLAEALFYDLKMTNRLGRIEEGNTVLDFLPEEAKRSMTVFLSMAPLEWRDCKINLIDTPGYADFTGEVRCALRAADSAVFAVCAVSGVEIQTELVWEQAVAAGLPRLVFVNKMDRENADFFRVLEDLREKFPQERMVPLQIPVGSGEDFSGIVDLLSETVLEWDREGGKWKQAGVPDGLQETVSTYRTELIEAAAEGDDELLMRYLDGEELSTEELKNGLRNATRRGDVIPVLCGSATRNIGTVSLLDAIVDCLPAPHESTKALASENGGPDDGFRGIVFKTLSDNFIGKISFLRICAGSLDTDMTLWNPDRETEEKVAHIYTPFGKKLNEIPEAVAGDIVCLTKLSRTVTGDTLCTREDPITLEKIAIPAPNFSKALSPKSKDDEDKLGNAFDKLLEEDPSLTVERNRETFETTINGLGDMHIDVLITRLAGKFGVEVDLRDPVVPYRETITKTVQRVEGKHKKQSGGHGQYGHVYIDVAPAEEDFVFEETIFGGSVPKNYIPAVEKGIRDAMENGVLAGYPMTRIKATLVDGSYHSVDSSEMAFKLAGSLALKAAVAQASPVLLEPIVKVQVMVPESYMGDIMGDLNTRRGKILGMEAKGTKQVISALAPQAEMSKYAIDLKSLTQGKGTFSMDFHSYDVVPANLTPRIIEEKKRLDEEKANA